MTATRVKRPDGVSLLRDGNTLTVTVNGRRVGTIETGALWTVVADRAGKAIHSEPTITARERRLVALLVNRPHNASTDTTLKWPIPTPAVDPDQNRQDHRIAWPDAS